MIYRNDDEFGAGLNALSHTTRALLARWRRNCLRSQIANYEAANRFSRRHLWFGIPSVLLSAIVATSVFATLETQLSLWPRIVVGLTSMLTAVFAALQTFLRFNERASTHRALGAEYGAIKREIDQILAVGNEGDCVSDEQLNTVRTRMDSVAKQAPEIPEDIWTAVHRTILPHDPSPSEAVRKS